MVSENNGIRLVEDENEDENKKVEVKEVITDEQKLVMLRSQLGQLSLSLQIHKEQVITHEQLVQKLSQQVVDLCVKLNQPSLLIIGE